MIGVAGRDAWLSAVPVTFLGVAVAFLTASLGRRFPGETLVGFSRKILGKPLGLFVGAAYVFWLMTIGALTLRGFSELILTFLLRRTPIMVLVVSFLLVSAMAVRGGIEVIARISQLSVPISIGFIFFGFAFSLPNIRSQNWLPILGNGFLPIWQGTYIAIAFFAEVIIGVLIILPYLNQQRHALRTLVTPVIILGGLMMASSALYVGVLGADIAGRVLFPALDVSRLVSVAEFIQNIESCMMVFWLFANFSKLTIWYYAATVALAENLGLQDYRSLAWPVGVLIGAFTLLLFSNVTEFFGFLRFSATPFMLLFELIIPILLWGVAYGHSKR